jgi:aldehyde:ferredoxin oxidoreductase
MTYTGAGIEIDVSTGEVQEFEIPEKLYYDYRGIIGIAYHYAEKLYFEGDPLSSDNFAIFAAGILTNTTIPGATKVIAVTKNPVNRTFGPAVGGGAFARDMKRAGFDLVILKGAAEKPCYVLVEDGRVSIEDATNLWGKDIVETTDYLKEKHKGSVLAIGKAGENRVPLSLTLIDAIHHLGKGGLGAVLGSKKIKAVVVKGSRMSEPANPQEFGKLVKEFRDRVKADPTTKRYADIGIMAAWDSWAREGYLAFKKKTVVVSQEVAEEFGVRNYKGRLKKQSTGCHGCLSPCKSILKAKLNDEVIETKASLYLGVAYEFGVKCGVESAEMAVRCHDVANRHGIDAMLFAELYDFVAALYEEGKVFADELDFEPSRSGEAVIKVLEMVAEGRDFGEYMGRGFEGLVEKFGKWVRKESHFIKNMESIFDPRVSFGSESFGLFTNPRGAHEGPVTITVLPGRDEEGIRRYMKRIGASDELINATFGQVFNAALYTIAAENWLWVLNGMGLCRRESIAKNLDIEIVASLFTHATGIESSPEELITSAEKAFTMARKLNCREGYSREHDKPPSRFFEPLKTWEGYKTWRDYFGRAEITPEMVEKMLSDYYAWRGWKDDGCP